jgi:hypothetical protein
MTRNAPLACPRNTIALVALSLDIRALEFLGIHFLNLSNSAAGASYGTCTLNTMPGCSFIIARTADRLPKTSGC